MPDSNKISDVGTSFNQLVVDVSGWISQHYVELILAAVIGVLI